MTIFVLQVIKVLSRYCDCVERASIDEAFLDVTSVVMERIRQHPEANPLITSSMLPGTHIAGYSMESTAIGEYSHSVYSYSTMHVECVR